MLSLLLLATVIGLSLLFLMYFSSPHIYASTQPSILTSIIIIIIIIIIDNYYLFVSWVGIASINWSFFSPCSSIAKCHFILPHLSTSTPQKALPL